MHPPKRKKGVEKGILTASIRNRQLLNYLSPSPFNITDPQVIRHILEHLGLSVQKSSRDPPSQEAPHENGEIVYEPR